VLTTIVKTTMKKEVIKSAERGRSDYGWLKSYHSFSFGTYQNYNNMGFGLLRVINNDTVAAGEGFGTHPHANMEIVSIPLEGNLAHKDSTGNEEVIKTGDVQIMSAGTGLTHSEYNHSKTDRVKFLQIWVHPKEKNINPRYEQKTFALEDRINNLQVVVAPNNENAVWINQDSWFSQIKLVDNEFTYNLNKPGNGVYVFIISGEIELNYEKYEARDGIGISEVDSIKIKSQDAEILFIEVPMK